ncbi:MAG TPA: putative sugar nucleotidyl transferase, partial [Bacteroidia bacterium]|nr:putative sugar nucleotidyl transferase [Bacteroidia bacterium]
MNIILADSNRNDLLPFTFVRPVAEIRCGILAIFPAIIFLFTLIPYVP